MLDCPTISFGTLRLCMPSRERTPISRDELLNQLRALVGPGADGETAHLTADMLLLAYIDDEEITEAFKAVERWYS